MEEGGDAIPEPQHSPGLHVLQVRRRCVGHRHVAELGEVVAWLESLPQRQIAVARVRGDDSIRDQGPRLLPAAFSPVRDHPCIRLSDLLECHQKCGCVSKQLLKGIEVEGGLRSLVRLVEVRRDQLPQPRHELRSAQDDAIRGYRRDS